MAATPGTIWIAASIGRADESRFALRPTARWMVGWPRAIRKLISTSGALTTTSLWRSFVKITVTKVESIKVTQISVCRSD